MFETEDHAITTFQQYDESAEITAAYPKGPLVPGDTRCVTVGFLYTSVALAGEVGEFANKVKKVIRDDGCAITPDRRAGMLDELGDALWYLSAIARELGSDLTEVANLNHQKLASRRERGKIHGDGDAR